MHYHSNDQANGRGYNDLCEAGFAVKIIWRKKKRKEKLMKYYNIALHACNCFWMKEEKTHNGQ